MLANAVNHGPHQLNWEGIDSVVESLNRDRRATGLSLTGITELCP